MNCVSISSYIFYLIKFNILPDNYTHNNSLDLSNTYTIHKQSDGTFYFETGHFTRMRKEIERLCHNHITNKLHHWEKKELSYIRNYIDNKVSLHIEQFLKADIDAYDRDTDTYPLVLEKQELDEFARQLPYNFYPDFVHSIKSVPEEYRKSYLVQNPRWTLLDIGTICWWGRWVDKQRIQIYFSRQGTGWDNPTSARNQNKIEERQIMRCWIRKICPYPSNRNDETSKPDISYTSGQTIQIQWRRFEQHKKRPEKSKITEEEPSECPVGRKTGTGSYLAMSHTAEFQQIYAEEVGRSGYPSWATDCVEDYFAEAFWKCCVSPGTTQSNLPRTYEYVMRVANMC